MIHLILQGVAAAASAGGSARRRVRFDPNPVVHVFEVADACPETANIDGLASQFREELDSLVSEMTKRLDGILEGSQVAHEADAKHFDPLRDFLLPWRLRMDLLGVPDSERTELGEQVGPKLEAVATMGKIYRGLLVARKHVEISQGLSEPPGEDVIREMLALDRGFREYAEILRTRQAQEAQKLLRKHLDEILQRRDRQEAETNGEAVRPLVRRRRILKAASNIQKEVKAEASDAILAGIVLFAFLAIVVLLSSVSSI